MTHHAPVKGLSALFAVGMAVLMVFVFASGSVDAVPTATSTSPATFGMWSYGNWTTISVGPFHTADGWVYGGNATFGYTVTISESNTSLGFELSIDRTMGASFALVFCNPSCASPTDWANLSYRAWETTNATSNFTRSALVSENGQNVTAVGLLGSTTKVDASVMESAGEHLVHASGIVDRAAYLIANLTGSTSVQFAPALGLFPTNLTAGSSWSSTSAFTAFGAAAYSYYFGAHGPLIGHVNSSGAGPIAIASTGTVTVNGNYAGSTVNVGGTPYPKVDLTVYGPFKVREGVIFVPDTADIFGGATHAWSSNASASTSATTSALDVKPLVNGHLDLGASSVTFATNSANPATASSSSSGVVGGLPAAATSNLVSNVTLQGHPESSQQATSTQSCLVSGAPGATCSSPSSAARSWLGTVVVIGAVVVVGAMIALAVVARRRKSPPPQYPNASMYPPGAAFPRASARAPAPPGTPSPPEEDPLGHLW